jgi:gas vesicle protein
MREQNGSAVRAMVFVCMGAGILGAAAGLLFAPKTGRETRKDLKKYANKVSQDAVEVVQRTKAGFEAAWEKGRALLESKAA